MPDPKARQPISFDQLNPPKTVTDPLGVGKAAPEYPKLLNRYGLDAQGTLIIERSTDGGPDYMMVGSPEGEAAAKALGYGVKPEDRLPRRKSA